MLFGKVEKNTELIHNSQISQVSYVLATNYSIIFFFIFLVKTITKLDPASSCGLTLDRYVIHN